MIKKIITIILISLFLINAASLPSFAENDSECLRSIRCKNTPEILDDVAQALKGPASSEDHASNLDVLFKDGDFVRNLRGLIAYAEKAGDESGFDINPDGKIGPLVLGQREKVKNLKASKNGTNVHYHPLSEASVAGSFAMPSAPDTSKSKAVIIVWGNESIGFFATRLDVEKMGGHESFKKLWKNNFDEIVKTARKKNAVTYYQIDIDNNYGLVKISDKEADVVIARMAQYYWDFRKQIRERAFDEAKDKDPEEIARKIRLLEKSISVLWKAFQEKEVSTGAEDWDAAKEMIRMQEEKLKGLELARKAAELYDFTKGPSRKIYDDKDINIADVGFEAGLHEGVNDFIAKAFEAGTIEFLRPFGERVYLVGNDSTMYLDEETKQEAHAGIGRGVIYIARGAYNKHLRADTLEEKIRHESAELHSWREEAETRGISYEQMREWIKSYPTEAQKLNEKFHARAKLRELLIKTQQIDLTVLDKDDTRKNAIELRDILTVALFTNNGSEVSKVVEKWKKMDLSEDESLERFLIEASTFEIVNQIVLPLLMAYLDKANQETDDRVIKSFKELLSNPIKRAEGADEQTARYLSSPIKCSESTTLVSTQTDIGKYSWIDLLEVKLSENRVQLLEALLTDGLKWFNGRGNELEYPKIFWNMTLFKKIEGALKKLETKSMVQTAENIANSEQVQKVLNDTKALIAIEDSAENIKSLVSDDKVNIRNIMSDLETKQDESKNLIFSSKLFEEIGVLLPSIAANINAKVAVMLSEDKVVQEAQRRAIEKMNEKSEKKIMAIDPQRQKLPQELADGDIKYLKLDTESPCWIEDLSNVEIRKITQQVIRAIGGIENLSEEIKSFKDSMELLIQA